MPHVPRATATRRPAPALDTNWCTCLVPVRVLTWPPKKVLLRRPALGHGLERPLCTALARHSTPMCTSPAACLVGCSARSKRAVGRSDSGRRWKFPRRRSLTCRRGFAVGCCAGSSKTEDKIRINLVDRTCTGVIYGYLVGKADVSKTEGSGGQVYTGNWSPHGPYVVLNCPIGPPGQSTKTHDRFAIEFA